MKILRYLIGFIYGCRITGMALALDIPLTIEEPSGVGRIKEPVTAGVPLPPGTQTSNWSLSDGTPVQVSVLPTLPNKSPWILLDFQVDLPSNGKKILTLREGGSVQPSQPVSISETGSQITVNTGPLEIVMRTDTFNLFESVKLNGALKAASTGGDNIQMVDTTTNQTLSGKGAPDRVEWEYRGPLRATLRVDGKFRDAGSFDPSKHLTYTTRISFFAGKPSLQVEYVLRNSYQPNERHAKVRSATLQIGNGGVTLTSKKPGARDYAYIGSNGLKFDVVPANLWGTDTVANKGILVVDLSYHGATVIADFSEGLTATDITRLTNAANHPVFPLAPASQYSEYGELTATKFSTLDDEKNAYTKWSWGVDNSDLPTDPLAQGTGKYIPDYNASWIHINIHDDPESDDLWNHILMYIRTGQRSYWDRAQAWARYEKWEYAYRTDGFDYAWNGNYERPSVSRPRITIPLTSADNTYLNEIYDPSGGERYGGRAERYWGGDHLWGWGLADYYYMTGDKDALEAVSDLAEFSWRIVGWRKIGGNCYPEYGCVGGGGRQMARNFLLITRAYEATQSSRWKTATDFLGQLFIQATDWDSRGSYMSSDGSGVKSMGPFHFGFVNHAMGRYYELTGNLQMRDKLIAMGNFGQTYGLDPVSNATGVSIIFDNPSPGDWRHDSYGGPPGDYEYTQSFIDSMVRAYRITKDNSLLDRAKTQWSYANRGTYGTLNPVAPPGQVGRFMNADFTSVSGWRYYDHNKGDLSYGHLFFYDASRSSSGPPDNVTPASPKNLRIR